MNNPHHLSRQLLNFFALVMEECEAARADRKATLAALRHLSQLCAANAVINANLREEHQRLLAGEVHRRKMKTQGKAKAPTSKSLKRRCPGCFNYGDEGHFNRECPQEHHPRELTHLGLFNAARKNQVPTLKKQKISVKGAQETQAIVDGTFFS